MAFDFIGNVIKYIKGSAGMPVEYSGKKYLISDKCVHCDLGKNYKGVVLTDPETGTDTPVPIWEFGKVKLLFET